jgi:hypothetical protein
VTIRESGVTAGIGWALAAWSIAFAINLILVADKLTSPQWTALMTVPGGKWLWFGLFGAAGATLLHGLIATKYRVRGVGMALVAVGCFGIGVFYIVAPLFRLGPITLGYWPWFLGVGIGVLGAVANWRPLEWF